MAVNSLRCVVWAAFFSVIAAGDAWAEEKTSRAGGEWAQFLGPGRRNVAEEAGLMRSWPVGGPPLLWESKGLGEGYASVVIADGMIYTMGSGKDEDKVISLRLGDGRKRWATAIGPHFEKRSGDGPRSTPVIDGGWVYALGAAGELVCLQARTGKIVWTKHIIEEYDSRAPMHGLRESVTIDGERLICVPGGKQAAVVALDKMTGEEIWRTENPRGRIKAGYASVGVSEGGGVRQYLVFHDRGILSVRARDGVLLWEDDSTSDTENCATPLVHGDYVFYSSAGRGGGVLLKLRGNGESVEARKIFETEALGNLYGGVVLMDDHLYGFNGGELTCIEFLSGRSKWESRVKRGDGRSIDRHGNLTYADGHLYMLGYGGGVALVEATPEAFRQEGGFMPATRGRLRRADGDPSYAQIVVTDGKMFVRDQDSLLCYDVRERR